MAWKSPLSPERERAIRRAHVLDPRRTALLVIDMQRGFIDEGASLSGPEAPDTIPDLAPQPGDLVIRAHTYDKFHGTPLDLALRSRGIRHLVVAGILADICVNATVLSASTREYLVTVVRDGTTTIWPEILEACLHIWARKFARIATIDEVIAEFEGRRS
ncbi:MAG: cysteine hydrolase [Planctomycetes bacterium]|nr:cysteine hydrolase [Planctomycetota bacterium]